MDTEVMSTKKQNNALVSQWTKNLKKLQRFQTKFNTKKNLNNVKETENHVHQYFYFKPKHRVKRENTTHAPKCSDVICCKFLLKPYTGFLISNELKNISAFSVLQYYYSF